MATAVSPQESQREEISALDGWRAIAALMVMFAHGVSRDTPLYLARPMALHALALFFALSGFLITSRLLSEKEKHGTIDISGFYLRRAFRIAPGLLTYLLALVALGFFGLMTPMPLKEFLSSLFFLENYVVPWEGRTAYTFHLWSLAVQEHFYILWPLLFAAFGSERLRKWIPWVAVAFIVWRQIDWNLNLVFSDAHPIFNRHRTDRVFDALLYGSYLAFALKDPRIKAWLTRALTPFVFWGLTALFLLSGYIHGASIETLTFLVAPLMIASTVLRPGDRHSRFFDWKPFKFLAKISFGLYLYQQILMVGAFRKPELLQTFPLNFVLLIAIAWATNRYIDTPLAAYGNKLARAWRARRAAQVQAVPAPVRVKAG